MFIETIVVLMDSDTI